MIAEFRNYADSFEGFLVEVCMHKHAERCQSITCAKEFDINHV